MVVSTTMISRLRHSAPSAHQRRREGAAPPLDPEGAVRSVAADPEEAGPEWFSVVVTGGCVLVAVAAGISSPDWLTYQ
jgi:hypothetical protein